MSDLPLAEIEQALAAKKKATTGPVRPTFALTNGDKTEALAWARLHAALTDDTVEALVNVAKAHDAIMRHVAELIVEQARCQGCDASMCPVYLDGGYDIPEVFHGCGEGLEHAFFGEPDEYWEQYGACIGAVVATLDDAALASLRPTTEEGEGA